MRHNGHLDEGHKERLLAHLQEMNAELDRLRPPHGKTWRERLELETEATIAQLKEQLEHYPEDPGMTKRLGDAELVLWALRIAEEVLPPGMAAR